jgi:hypothetical protein
VRTGGVHDGWDLAVSAGPLIRCQLTTAVAWNWTPLHRAAYRPRLPLLAAVVGVAGVALAAPLLGLAALALVLAAATVEAFAVRRMVHAAVRTTTVGA